MRAMELPAYHETHPCGDEGILLITYATARAAEEQQERLLERRRMELEQMEEGAFLGELERRR